MDDPREESTENNGDASENARVTALRNAARTGIYYRSFRASIALGLLVTLFATVYVSPDFAVRYALFVAWTLANFMLWDHGLREIFGPRRFWIAGPLIVAKIFWVVLLVVLVYWAEVGKDIQNFLAFLLGFHTLFLVMSLKILGASLVNTQKTQPAKRAAAGGKPRLIESGRKD